MLDKEDFDVIVSDYQMPRMDGLEFLEVVREEKESDIPFIIFTGKGREEVAIKALNLGADRYLQKGGSPKSQYDVLAKAVLQEVEHHKTQRALYISEQRYKSITEDVMDHSDVAMFILDSNFEIIWINKATEDYFGIDKEEVIGKDKEELIRNKIKHIFENPDYFEEKVVTTYKDNTYIEYFECHVLEDEEKGIEERWLKHWSKPIETGLYQGGRMEHYTDITDIKKSERENEKHLNELDERFKELNCLYSLEKIIEDNDKIEDFFSQAVKLIPPSWQYPDITEARITYEDQVFKTEDFKETEWMQKSEITVQKKEVGKVEVGYLEKRPEEDEGPFLKEEVDLINSITDRIGSYIESKRMEKRFRKIFENLGDAVIIKALGGKNDGRILKANQAMCDLLGYSREELDEMNVYDDLVSDDPEKTNWKEIKAELKKGRRTKFSVKKKKKDGSEVWVEVVAVPLRYQGKNSVLAVSRDISERKEKESALKASEERYRRLFETAQDGMLILNAETGKIKDANPYIRDLLGYSKEELVGKELWEIGTFRNVVENRERFDELLDEGYVRYEDLPLETKYGEEAPVEFVSNTYEAGGEEVVQCNIRDISDRKKAEEKIKETKERLDLALEGTKAGIWDWCVQTGKTVFNERWAEIVGYELEELEPTSIETWRELAHPEDLERSEELLEEHFAGETDMYEFEGRMKHKDGHWVWILDRGKVVEWDDEGNPIRMTGTHEDITEQKEARDRIENNKNKIERLHKVSAELETCQSEKEILNLAVDAVKDILEFDLCSFAKVEDNKFIVKKRTSGLPEGEYLERSLEEGGIDTKTYQNQKSYLIKNVNKNKDAKPVSSKYKSAMSIPIGEYGVFQAVATEENFFDEDDLNTTELLIDEITSALKRLEMREREKFLHTLLRHDVRNKSVLVQGYLDLAKEFDLTEEVEEYIRRAKNVTANSKEIIDKVRKLRKIEEKNKISEVKIKSILNQVVSDYDEELKQNDIDLDLDGKDKTVKGGSLLEDLFSNLIENSIRHSDCNKIKINIRSEDDECIVTLEDDGKGIKDEDKNRIFEKGYKYGESGGTGLGMYLVKEIVESYGGSVEVKDSELGGARFDVHLQRMELNNS